MAKRKDRNHALESESRGVLQATLSDWVLNPLDREDYAFDFELRPTGKFVDRGRVQSQPCYVQLKATHVRDDPEKVWWDIETDFLSEDCLTASVPVVLVVYEQRQGGLYWCVLQPYCWDVLDDSTPGWREQTTVRIQIERAADLRALGDVALKTALAEARRRITFRMTVGTERNTSFDQPSMTTVASTEAVEKYKRDRLTAAEGHITVDRTDRALRLLMDLYQLPETDEPTLEAIAHLIKLREIDDVYTAIVQIRFATEGHKLAKLYNRPSLAENFTEVINRAGAIISEHFVGATYRHEWLPLHVLECRPSSIGDPGTNYMALVQWGGDLEEFPALNIAAGEEFELMTSGSGRGFRNDACDPGEHTFDPEALRDAPDSAICDTCGLSRQTVEAWLDQPVPGFCNICETVVENIAVDQDIRRCPTCR